MNNVTYHTNPRTGLLEWITLPRMSNFHGHLRSGNMLRAIGAASLGRWKYFLAMPNTGPITTVEEMLTYYRLLTATRDEAGLDTIIIPTIYLTAALTTSEVERMAGLDIPCAVKYYPTKKGTTTGSGLGIPLSEAKEVLIAMARNGVRLLGHFESEETVDGAPIPDIKREGYFAQHHFPRLREENPDLKITFEHITTELGVNAVTEDDSGMTTCTITPQAMLLVNADYPNLTWSTHAKCMPVAKLPHDREAVRRLAFSGDSRAYLGDDTAPHPSAAKLKPFGEAASGCYLPHSAAWYVRLFYDAGALKHLPAFACHNAPDAWGLPRPTIDEHTLFIRDTHDIPDPTPIVGEDGMRIDEVVPFGWATEGSLHPGLKLFIPS